MLEGLLAVTRALDSNLDCLRHSFDGCSEYSFWALGPATPGWPSVSRARPVARQRPRLSGSVYTTPASMGAPGGVLLQHSLFAPTRIGYGLPPLGSVEVVSKRPAGPLSGRTDIVRARHVPPEEPGGILAMSVPERRAGFRFLCPQGRGGSSPPHTPRAHALPRPHR